MVDTHAGFVGRLPATKRRLGSNAAILSVVAVVIAAGFITNERSYLLLPLLIGVSMAMRRPSMQQSRLFMIGLTLILCFYGAILGLLKGHNVVYIMKFFAPIFVFAVWLSLRNIGQVLYANRRSILVMCFVISALFTLFIKFWISGAIGLLMRGWTVDDYTRTAVSVFHYFALAFCLVQIFEFVAIKATSAGMIRTFIAVITIILLTYLTYTSAFDLAVAAGIVGIFARFFRFAIMIRVMFAVIVLVLVDYFTIQYVTQSLEDYLVVLASSDEGNSVRMIQIQYFISNITLLGEGFGAEHAFETFSNSTRQYMQEVSPYSSELPILNIINSAGLIAALWFFLAVKPVFHCVTLIRSKDDETAKKGYFGLACGLVLVGSISNPFFFSPVSMLLLCAAADVRSTARTSV